LSLPIHPPPNFQEKLTEWVDRLAIANRTPFRIMFRYIGKHSREMGLIDALDFLTGVETKDILKLENDFKPQFWDNPKECPIIDCDYISKRNYADVYTHLIHHHDLGIEWYNCPHCEHQAKSKWSIKEHLKFIHNIGTTTYQCQECDFNNIDKSVLKRHIRLKHDDDAPRYE